MLQVRSLPLPQNFPTDKAIKSAGQNIHYYDPELWEFQYEGYRYLKNISDQKLINRYKDLCINFTVFSGNDRDKIPINSYQSSWYWYRKEHQTRYEFFLRKLSLPEPPKPRTDIKKPVSHDILYKYGYNESITTLFEFGCTKIRPASSYKKGNSSDPRTDDEKNKERWFVGDHSKLTTLNGDEIKTIGDTKSSISACDYYMFCLSCDFEQLMFEKFGYDSCLIIKNPKEFALRLEAAFKKRFPEWRFHGNPIHYFDPFERKKNEYFSPTMSKDFSFAYQKEYRFLLDPLKPTEEIKSLSEFKIQLGPLRDICELYRVKST